MDFFPVTTPGGTMIWFPQPHFSLDQGAQDWGSPFTGAFVTTMKLKKLLSSGPSLFNIHQSFLKGPFQ